MEIMSLLRLTWWRILGLLVAAAISAGLTVSAVSNRPVTFSSTGRVFVAQIAPPEAGPFSIPSLLADFQGALELDQVRDAVATTTGVADADLVVESQRVGDGTSVEVSAVGPDGEQTRVIVEAMSTEALLFLAQQQVDNYFQLENQRKVQVDNARARLSDFLDEIGFGNPREEQAAFQAQAVELRIKADDPSEDFTESERSSLRNQAREIEEVRLPLLAQQVEEFNQLEKAVAEAEQAEQTARRDRIDADAVIDLINQGSIVAVGEPQEQSRIPLLVQGAAAATIVVFAVGVALFFVFDWLTGNRRPPSASEPVTAPTEPATATPGFLERRDEPRVPPTSPANEQVRASSPPIDFESTGRRERRTADAREAAAPAAPERPVESVSPFVESSEGNGRRNEAIVPDELGRAEAAQAAVSGGANGSPGDRKPVEPNTGRRGPGAPQQHTIDLTAEPDEPEPKLDRSSMFAKPVAPTAGDGGDRPSAGEKQASDDKRRTDNTRRGRRRAARSIPGSNDDTTS